MLKVVVNHLEFFRLLTPNTQRRGCPRLFANFSTSPKNSSQKIMSPSLQQVISPLPNHSQNSSTASTRKTSSLKPSFTISTQPTTNWSPRWPAIFRMVRCREKCSLVLAGGSSIRKTAWKNRSTHCRIWGFLADSSECWPIREAFYLIRDTNISGGYSAIC